MTLIRKTKFTDDAKALFKLMKARGASGIVIGLPVNMDGTEGPRCQSVRAFARNLLRLDETLPIAFWDERLSSAAVNRMLIAEADPQPRQTRRRRGPGGGGLHPPGSAGPAPGLRPPFPPGHTPYSGALMSPVADVSETIRARLFPFPKRHFVSAADLDPPDVAALLDLADAFVELNRQTSKKLDLLKGRTLINLFFENSTRTQSSFELAGKRLGADVVNMSPRASSMAKGETLIDTAVTLNAMQPDLLVMRHARRARLGAAGAEGRSAA